MSNYMNYTLFYGYCVNEKFDKVKELQESNEKFWDGVPEFSLNYSNNEIGYKLVNDNIGNEGLYFGVELYECDEYNSGISRSFDLEKLEEMYLDKIKKKYISFFNELPNGKPRICFICECL